MSLARLQCHRLADAPVAASHVLWVLPFAKQLPEDLPGKAQWQAVLSRRQVKPAELAKTPQSLDMPDGSRVVLVMMEDRQSRFERLTLLRKAVMPLLEEHPRELVLQLPHENVEVAQDALYVTWVNAFALPVRKKKPVRALERIHVHSALGEKAFDGVAALARANCLARELTALPPNELTPADYRRRLKALAKARSWEIEEYDFRRLKKMGAGAFCAVAQGSGHEDAAIVRLSYRPKGGKGAPAKDAKRLALVGKGICFDTGGHNLKPARYMAGMHEDMNGSAVALALLQLASEQRWPVAVDAWLAIAHNHLSPTAYKQNDIVTALDGTTIEVVHTDAEGRMVLADTLCLAAREKPDLVVDFATLTGSMVTALGTRYCGVFASREALGSQAVTAGRMSGERVCLFPLDADYEPALDSKVADIKQCTLEGDADHILAARFLKRFVGERDWVHVDLSAASCEGGLGALAGALTGFGVAWGGQFLTDWQQS